jgi:hypothetical protein
MFPSQVFADVPCPDGRTCARGRLCLFSHDPPKTPPHQAESPLALPPSEVSVSSVAQLPCPAVVPGIAAAAGVSESVAAPLHVVLTSVEKARGRLLFLAVGGVSPAFVPAPWLTATDSLQDGVTNVKPLVPPSAAPPAAASGGPSREDLFLAPALQKAEAAMKATGRPVVPLILSYVPTAARQSFVDLIFDALLRNGVSRADAVSDTIRLVRLPCPTDPL